MTRVRPIQEVDPEMLRLESDSDSDDSFQLRNKRESHSRKISSQKPKRTISSENMPASLGLSYLFPTKVCVLEYTTSNS
jgi:hypothetical protein